MPAGLGAHGVLGGQGLGAKLLELLLLLLQRRCLLGNTRPERTRIRQAVETQKAEAPAARL